MVVDDEVEILHSLWRLLTRAGFEVETAATPAAALDRLDGFKPDLVLSDYRMPVMTGVELLAEVKRRQPLTARVMVSGNADLAAADDVDCPLTTKPWDLRQLIKILRATIAIGRVAS